MAGEPIRAAIMADTHGVLRPEVKRVLETCDVIIHAGDFDNQMIYHKLSSDWPLYGVRGNNDRGWSGGLPLVKRFQLGNVKFVMAHERTDIPSVLGDTQVVIYGHSHMYQQQEISGRLWLNPGSCGYKRFTLPLSLAVMTISDGTYSLETIWLEKGYGTPGDAIAQREQKAGRYEKRQKAYKQKQAQKQGQGQVQSQIQSQIQSQSDEQAQCEGPWAALPSQKDRLFLIARVLRQRQAGSTAQWAAESLNIGPELAEQIYKICEAHPGAQAKEVLKHLQDWGS